MKLQLALDIGSTKSLLTVAELVEEWVDLFEAGTPWILREGVGVIRELRNNFPGKKIVADMKILDAGYEEARLAFNAGADLVTVMGVAGECVVQRVIDCATELEGQLIVDLMHMENPLHAAAQFLHQGAHYVAIHSATDHTYKIRDNLKSLIARPHTLSNSLVVAGGIDLQNIRPILRLNPAIVIVGRAITNAQKPHVVASEMKTLLKGGTTDGE